ncbi:MAG: hypothetical protein J6Y02_01315 [Pseudobutyrivibrio sp.]|nr:hypothetical protein [Pseudobutyrivibrio sp.]
MAKYCLYCEEEKTSGECNKTIMANVLKLNGIPIATNEIFIQNGNEMAIFVNNYMTGQYYDYKTKKIKYCPMCGKKLENLKCD